MSKLTKCKACGKEVAKGAKTCPECGKDQRNFFGKHKLLTGIGVVVILIAIGSAMGNNYTQTASENVETGVKQEVKKETKTDVKQAEEKAEEKEKAVPTEYKSALKKAYTYQK